MPGFGILEDPLLYVLPVGRVANQVACELQEFAREHQKDPIDVTKHRWRLGNEDAVVKLTLSTDSTGYVNFTGVNVASLGFETLASFIATQSKVSTFAAKLTGKRSRSVEVDFTVSPNPLPSTRKTLVVDPATKKVTEITLNCANNAYANNPLTSLYLRDWLTNYFETINTTPGYQPPYNPKYPTDEVARGIRDIVRPEAIPAQFKIQSGRFYQRVIFSVTEPGIDLA